MSKNNMLTPLLCGLAFLVASVSAACPDTCAYCQACYGAGEVDVNSTFSFAYAGTILECSYCADEACADCALPYDCADCTIGADAPEMYGRSLFGQQCYDDALTFYGGAQCAVEALIAGDTSCKEPALKGEYTTCMASAITAEDHACADKAGVNQTNICLADYEAASFLQYYST